MADATSTVTDPLVGQTLGKESSLSNWAGDYVTNMLGRGQALSEMPYNAYSGPLVAGQSDLQNQAFQGLASLVVPTNTSFTPQSFTDPGVSQQYMNPYLTSALAPQIDELTRRNQIETERVRSDLTKAGAYGGSRQAVMESELNRNLNDQIAQVLGTGYRDAYTQGANQFNTEQNLGLNAANQAGSYGLAALNAMQNAGNTQRDITQQGVAADYAQYEQERMEPYKQVQFLQSLLQGLPVEAQSYNYQEPSALSQFMTTTGGISDFWNLIFGDGGTSTGGDQ